MRDIQHYLRPGTLQLTSLPPLSLYVHLPWCLKKCPYCDFNSHEMRQPDLPEQRYLDALLADLEAALPLVWGRSVHSIFLGGGTPSLFSPESIDRLLGGIRARLKLAADCEVTLEANPGTFEKDRFRAFRDAGVTRLSVGVQSFSDEHLKTIGRVHDRAQLRHLEPGPDVRLAGADTGGPAAGGGPGAGLRAAAPVDLPPDHRAQHLVRQASAPAAGG